MAATVCQREARERVNRSPAIRLRMTIPSLDGDVAANPPGFDRAAFLKQLAKEKYGLLRQGLLGGV